MGNDTINFQDLDQVSGTVVGRLEDFDASRDTIKIEGTAIDLNNLSTSAYDVKVVSFNGGHNDVGSTPQQWLLINTSAGGHIFYSLEGARVDMTGNGGARSRTQEAHFVPDARLPANLNSLTEVAYIDQVNFVPDTAIASGSGGITYNDIDVNASDVTETISVANNTATNNGDLIAAGINDDSVDAGLGNDQVWGGSGHDTVQGGGGNDTLYGGTSNDVLGGGDGADKLYGDHGNDTIYGDNGNDTIQGGLGDDLIIGANNNDRIGGGEGDDSLRGDNGNDRIWGDEGKDTIQGGSGHDTLSGGDGNDRIGGGNNNDRVFGGDGNDRLYGDGGNDKIFGDNGNDILSGGSGNDVFVFRSGGGGDTITDFNNGNNRIDLSATGANSFSSLTITSGPNGSSNVDYGSGDIDLRFVNPSALTSDDFIF
ncbi:calcium-binding protein [Sulfitobacter donghicola]|uniref:calcium-binding protein n=1 Tax=Sulfitobacter donghicola TaxID=421000 RepID=UPI00138E1642|nr:calcium-binding protein [Sulfitobacter donghicola]